jgi:hypothetical protein
MVEGGKEHFFSLLVSILVSCRVLQPLVFSNSFPALEMCLSSSRQLRAEALLAFLRQPACVFVAVRLRFSAASLHFYGSLLVKFIITAFH